MPNNAEPGTSSNKIDYSAVKIFAVFAGLAAAFGVSLWLLAHPGGFRYSLPIVTLFVAVGIFSIILLRYAGPKAAAKEGTRADDDWTRLAVRAARTGSIFAGLGLAFMGCLLLISLPGTTDQFKNFSYLIPIIFLFIAIGVFLVILLNYAVTLKDYGVSFDPTALGLPEGSIRAFIAIALIALVAVFGSFLFFETKGSQYTEIAKVSLNQADVASYRAALPAGFILSPKESGPEPATYRIIFVESNAAKIDIAKQLLTMIVTVLTTVIGFYFGAKTAEQRSDGDAAKRAEISNAARESLKAYNDADASLRKGFEQLKNDAAAGLPDDAGKQAVQAELTRIEGLIGALKSRADQVKVVVDDAAAEIKSISDARDKAAKLTQDQTKLKTQIETADKEVKEAANDGAKRVIALKKVGAA